MFNEIIILYSHKVTIITNERIKKIDGVEGVTHACVG